jgi:hypothetical protein
LTSFSPFPALNTPRKIPLAKTTNGAISPKNMGGAAIA